MILCVAVQSTPEQAKLTCLKEHVESVFQSALDLVHAAGSKHMALARGGQLLELRGSELRSSEHDQPLEGVYRDLAICQSL